MSWKSVELQVALPRTVEQTRTQQIQQHQTTLQNMADAENLVRQERVDGQTVIETTDTARAQIRERQQGRQTAGDERRHREGEQDAAEEANLHPYKGHRLDIKM